MAGAEIAALTALVIEAAKALYNLGNNWYEASAAWGELSLKLDSLQQKCDIWDEAFKATGMASPFLMKTLSDTKAWLLGETAKLEKSQGKCVACRSKTQMAIFSKLVGLKIQHAVNVFDAIADNVQLQHQAPEAAEKATMHTVPSLPFREDARYVPLKDTEARVRAALDDPRGPPLVLLHGAAGKGKSTLAGHVALEYSSKCKNEDARFELVVFLECGPKAELTTSQFKLLQLLGSSAVVAPSPQEQGQTGSDVLIEKQLKGRLRDRKMLLILDDVPSLEFLQEMSNLCGARVKCLVTSQERHLCDGLSSTRRPIPVQIEDVQTDVAMQILASHVGFTNNEIPGRIQGQALKLIEDTASNPSALAIVGRAIQFDRKDELKEWEAISYNFLQLLQSDDRACVLGKIYPKSFWSAIVSSIQSLREEAQKLLILVYMCDDTLFVPEEVLQILYSSAIFKGGSQTFEQSRKHLESRGLVKISCTENISSEKERSWSLHSLQKLLIDDETKGSTEFSQHKHSLLEVLATHPNGIIVDQKQKGKCVENGAEGKGTRKFSGDHDAIVQISLCALYFDDKFSSGIKSKMDIEPNQLNSLRRTAIEPVTRLLGLYESDRWTKAAKSFAKKIFLNYIYDSVLHNDSIVNLVALPISVLPVLRALEGIATVESKTTLIGGNSEDLIKALVDLLGGPSDTGDITRVTSARIFHRLSLNKSHCGVIRSSGILEVLVKLSEDRNVDLKNTAADILYNLDTMNTDGTPECSSGYTNETPECSSAGYNNETPECSGAGYTNETPECSNAGCA